jgi:hypothetical protein
VTRAGPDGAAGGQASSRARAGGRRPGPDLVHRPRHHGRPERSAGERDTRPPADDRRRADAYSIARHDRKELYTLRYRSQDGSSPPRLRDDRAAALGQQPPSSTNRAWYRCPQRVRKEGSRRSRLSPAWRTRTSCARAGSWSASAPSPVTLSTRSPASGAVRACLDRRAGNFRGPGIRYLRNLGRLTDAVGPRCT